MKADQTTTHIQHTQPYQNTHPTHSAISKHTSNTLVITGEEGRRGAPATTGKKEAQGRVALRRRGRVFFRAPRATRRGRRRRGARARGAADEEKEATEVGYVNNT